MSPELSDPLKLPCGATLPNRLVKAALTEGLSNAMNHATERHVRIYRRWAEGGAGLLVTGNVQVDRTHLERPGNIVIDNNGGFEELRTLARAGTAAGNHFWMQINQPGRQTPANINPTPLAPSAVPVNAADTACGNPVAMTEAQILDVIRRFVHAATVARECGFTGVQVHAAHGYLMSQFLSPLSNLRTDAWGGPLENRARILLEIVRQIRKAVGSDFPVSVKLNSADFQKGGFSEEESMQVVRWLGEEKIDLLEISGGNYEQVGQMMRRSGGNGGGEEEVKTKRMAESTRRREAYFLDYADKVRPLVKMPLMITGGFRSREVMVGALQAGEVDVIGLGRPLCVMPDVCTRLLKNELDNAPAPERLLSLERDALGLGMDDKMFHSMETWSQVAWACIQLIRMGDGKDPDLDMTLMEALSGFDAHERAALEAWQLTN